MKRSTSLSALIVAVLVAVLVSTATAMRNPNGPIENTPPTSPGAEDSAVIDTIRLVLSRRHNADGEPTSSMVETAATQNTNEGVVPISSRLRVSDTATAIGLDEHRAVSVAAAASIPNRTLCTLTESATAHVKFATEYYASTFPGINWKFQWAGGTWWPSGRQAARWWAINGNTQCDGLVGPGWSSAAIAMSPLVDTAWIDPSATATELSDKTKHNTFSRDIPTDAVAAVLVAEVMSSLGWKKSNVFCVDDTYGRSLFNGFKEAWETLNNTLETGLCLPSDASDAMVENAVRQFVESQTRTLYLVFRSSDAAGFKFLTKLRPHATALNLFYSEALCDAHQVQSMNSGLCLSYYHNKSKIDGYLTAYRATNFSSTIQDLVALGGTTAQIGPLNNQESGYAMFIHDAAHHMMKAMYEHKVTNSSEKLFKYLRTVVSAGATGTVRLNDRGDRIAVDAKVVNFYHDKNRSYTVGFLHDGKYDPINGTATLYSFLGQAPSTSIPSDSKPQPPQSSSSSTTTWIIIAAAVLVVVLIICVTIVVLWTLLCRPKTRDNSAAPTDPKKPYAMVFTDIQASTRLWASAPEHMGEAIDLHHAVIRKVIAKYGGYEVKTIGDAFMVAFKTAEPALDFALAVQHGLFEAPWNSAAPIDETYQEILNEMVQGICHPVGPAYDALWNGLRVRVGVHYGTGEIKHDETTLGYDYYGTVVNTAARVEAVGHGGQVLITAEVYDIVSDCGRSPLDNKRKVTVLKLGPQPLRGLNAPVELFQVLPLEFAARQFPALRLDVEVEDHEQALLQAESTGGIHQQQSEAKSRTGSSRSGSVLTSSPEDIAAVCIFLAKRLSKNTNTMDPAAFMDIFDVLKTMFATAKPKFRTSTLQTLAERWRAPPLRFPPELRGAAQGITADDAVLLAILTKAVAATETSKRLGHGPLGGSAVMTRVSTFGKSQGSSFLGGRSASNNDRSQLAMESPGAESAFGVDDQGVGTLTINVPQVGEEPEVEETPGQVYKDDRISNTNPSSKKTE